MTFEEGHSLDVCMVPGAIQLTAAKEVQTRNAAFRSLLHSHDRCMNLQTAAAKNFVKTRLLH